MDAEKEKQRRDFRRFCIEIGPLPTTVLAVPGDMETLARLGWLDEEEQEIVGERYGGLNDEYFG
jgi:hypothetical protein